MPLWKRRPVSERLTPPATRAATFAEAWDVVRNEYTEPNPVTQPHIFVTATRQVVDWVREGVQPDTRGFSEGDLYANALMLGAFCLVAGYRGETPMLFTPDKSFADLPRMSDFPQNATNVTFKINVPPAVFGVDSWVHFKGGLADYELEGGGGPRNEHLVHAGVHILGAMTLLPERSAVGVVPQHDDGPSRYYRPPINMAGAPPFPNDIAPPQLQPL